jgi:hypothetical protein
MENKKDITKVFDDIFDSNVWGSDQSRSGPGSVFSQTEELRRILPGFLKKYDVKTMLDIPCGDFFWMKEIKNNLSGVLDRYNGADIVEKIISSNNNNYSDSKFSFQVMNLLSSDLPKSDLIFCRDCLVHLSYSDIYKALVNVKRSGSKYLLTTSFTSDLRKNKNIRTGSWRPINLRKRPFVLSAPEDIIDEKCTENEGVYTDKCMLLWKVSEMNLINFYLILILSKIKNVFKVG